MAVEALRFREVVRRSRFPALDGLRALAVLTVIVGHAEYPRGVPADLGVDAFFVLSGFLITRLLMREREASGGVSLPKFYARRTIRIFPAYYAFLLLNFAFDTVRGQRWGSALGISALTYTVNYFNAFHHHPPTSIAHAWSLAIEEQFYLVWPLAFVFLTRKGGRRGVAIGVACMALAALAWRSYLTLAGADVAYLYNAFDTRLDSLAVGCLLAIVADNERVARTAEALASRAWAPLITLGVLVTIRNTAPSVVHYSVGFTIYAVLVAILISQLMLLYQHALWSWLEHPWLKYLGAISYPMYLYHGFGFTVGRHSVSGEPLNLVVSFAATVAIASGSYFVIERPFLKLKRRFEPKGRTVISPPASPLIDHSATNREAIGATPRR